MKSQTSSSANSSALLHCQYRFPSQRFCRLPISDHDSGCCSKHAADHQKDLDQADLAAVLIGDIEEFRDAVTINHSLGELYKLLAKNKITPRRGAVMAYTANLLLRTLPAIQQEMDNEPQRIIIDMPGSDRDDPVPPSHPNMSWLTPGADGPNSKESSCLP